MVTQSVAKKYLRKLALLDFSFFPLSYFARYESAIILNPSIVVDKPYVTPLVYHPSLVYPVIIIYINLQLQF